MIVKQKQTNWQLFDEHDNPETGGSSSNNDEAPQNTVVELVHAAAPSSRRNFKRQWGEDFSMELEDSEITTQSTVGSSTSRTVRPLESDGSQLASPIFYAPSFEEIFEYSSKVHLKINIQSLSKEYSTDAGAISDAGSFPNLLRNESRLFSRTDSTMEANFKTLLYKNWESSKGFFGFRRRMGSDLKHKYCSYYRINGMIFIFVQVVMGIFLACVAIERLQNCQEEYYVFAYLMSDGILSVFLFPIIIMNWVQRVGGCLNEDDKLESGVYWITSLIMRVLTLFAGTVLLVFNESIPVGENMNVCQITYIVFFISVCAEWTYLVFCLLIPMVIYVAMYWCAPFYK